MGTYDTRGGTPRHDTNFDYDYPCETCGKDPYDCMCPELEEDACSSKERTSAGRRSGGGVMNREFNPFIKKRKLRNGEPCKHPGCLSHITHPCEKCGTQWSDAKCIGRDKCDGQCDPDCPGFADAYCKGDLNISWDPGASDLLKLDSDNNEIIKYIEYTKLERNKGKCQRDELKVIKRDNR